MSSALETSKATPITAKKSHSDERVSVNVRLRCSGWQSDQARIEGSTELTVHQARTLAASLLSLCDQADAKVAKKAAKEDRRKKWRDREVAAGRIKIMDAREFLHGRR